MPVVVYVNASNDISGVIESEEELRAVAKVLGLRVYHHHREDGQLHITLTTSLPARGFELVAVGFGVGDWIWIQAQANRPSSLAHISEVAATDADGLHRSWRALVDGGKPEGPASDAHGAVGDTPPKS